MRVPRRKRLLKVKLSRRKEQVLKAVVKYHVETAQPAASRVLVKKYKLGYSPATIRNEMLELEEQGFLWQPHVSAGRIPSDIGYRYFINRLMEVRLLSPLRRLSVWEKVEKLKGDPVRVIEMVAEEISKTFRVFAFGFWSCMRPPRVKFVEIVDIGGGKATLVVVFDNGIVHEKLVTYGDPKSLSSMRRELKEWFEKYKNVSIDGLVARAGELKGELGEVLKSSISEAVVGSFGKVYVAGWSCALTQPEFRKPETFNRAAEILEGGSELKGEVLKYDHEVSEEKAGTKIIIGEEAGNPRLREFSLLFTKVCGPCDTEGYIGLFGPKRLPYWEIVGFVKSVRLEIERLWR